VTPDQLLAIAAVACIAVASLVYADRTPPISDLLAPILRRTAPRALGYVTVAGEGGDSWELLRDETRVIYGACTERGIELGRVVREVERERSRPRPGLKYVLERLSAGTFDCLVVTRLEQLATSESDLARTLHAIEERDLRLIVIEIDYDSAGDDGRLVSRAPA